jgi:hypothetical protein
MTRSKGPVAEVEQRNHRGAQCFASAVWQVSSQLGTAPALPRAQVAWLSFSIRAAWVRREPSTRFPRGLNQNAT